MKAIKFSAPWCMKCKVLTPQYEKVKETMSDKVEFVEVNVDEDPDSLAPKYGIMSIPAMVFVKDDEVKDQFVGFRPSEQIQEIIETHI